jgi:replicative DNA helicase
MNFEEIMVCAREARTELEFFNVGLMADKLDNVGALRALVRLLAERSGKAVESEERMHEVLEKARDELAAARESATSELAATEDQYNELMDSISGVL